MDEINLFQLKKEHLPLKVEEYETCEGSRGFCISTINKKRIVFDTGSYGYDTYFTIKEDAEKNKNFLNYYLLLLEKSKKI